MRRNHSTHTNKLLRRIGQTWGDWENRQWSAKEPSAPKGMIDAWCNDRFAVQLFDIRGRQWLLQ